MFLVHPKLWRVVGGYGWWFLVGVLVARRGSVPLGSSVEQTTAVCPRTISSLKATIVVKGEQKVGERISLVLP